MSWHIFLHDLKVIFTWKAAAIVAAVILGAILGARPALAQSGNYPPPPSVPLVDTNRVNVLTGAMDFDGPQVSIGPVGQGGLTYRSLGNSEYGNEWVSTVKRNASNTIYVVTLRGASETFLLDESDNFAPASHTGGTLTKSGGNYTYTNAAGAIANFEAVTWTYCAVWCVMAAGTSITYPSGEVITLTLRTGTNIIDILSINNNYGYQIKLNYQIDSPSAGGILLSVIAINNTIEYCNPTVNCSPAQTWPTLTFSSTPNPATTSITDAVGNATTFGYSYNSPAMKATYSMTRPSGRQISYVADWCYECDPMEWKSVTDGSSSLPWRYQAERREYDGTILGHVWDPLGRERQITAYLFDPRPLRDVVDVGGLELTTTYDYTYNKLLPTRITYPEGNRTDYTYDERGNVTGIYQVGKPSSGVSEITTTATYASSCNSTNFRHCNKPLSVTDARGNTTTYTYADEHGGILTETGPAVGAGQPQTRYSYQALYAWYKNSSGSIVQASSPVYVLTGTSTCLSGSASHAGANWGTKNWGDFIWAGTAACIGTAQETVVTNGYESGSSSVAVNINLLSTKAAAGDNASCSNPSLCAITSMTYDSYGNVATKTGPRSGDVTAYFYDLNRQQTGAIRPDPDGGGALKYPAVKTTYDVDARVSKTEQGTTTSQSSMSSFDSVLQKTLGYQSSYFAPVTLETSFVGGLSHPVSATQTNYDQVRNVECVAIRQDMLVLGSLPSACTKTTVVENRPDQIKKNGYDAANRLLTVQRGVDTADVITEVTNVYTANSKIDYLEDANGNRSDYTYDGHDRLVQLNFPSKTTAHTASGTDYEQYGLDANGNRISWRLRSGETIGYTYDAMNRQTVKDIPGGTASDVYSEYNLPGALLYARYGSPSGSGVDFSYDALGRKTSETTYGRAITSQYDAAGNRTHLIYPDSVDIEYTYDVLNRMKQVKQSSTVLAEYGYDDLGRVTGISRANSTATILTYGATSLDRTLTQDLANTGQDVGFSMTFTPAQQMETRGITNAAYRFSAPALSASYTRNGLNQYTAVGGNAFTYDGRGNLTSDSSRAFVYDLENRLTAVSGSASMTLGYDPKGRMQQTIAASVTQQYLYDGDDLIVEYSNSGTVLRRYVPGRGEDETLVWYEGSNLSTPSWLQTDQQGSLINVSNNSGSGGTPYRYSPSGEPEGGWVNAPATPIFRYTGQAALPQIGLYYYKARMYDPVLGRFLQTDPIGYKDSWNLYAYVGNDPANKVDPTGNWLDTIVDIGFIASDLYSISQEGFTAENTVALGGDMVGALLPFASGLGKAAVLGFGIPKGIDGAKSLTKGEQLALNKAGSIKGEAATRAKLGDNVAGEQVTFRTSVGSKTRMDFVTKDRMAIDSKNGGGDFRPNQRQLKQDIDSGKPVTPLGKNAENAGLKHGEPIVMKGCEIDRTRC